MERLIVELEASEERSRDATRGHALSSQLELVALAFFTGPSAKDAKEVVSSHYARAHQGEAIAAVFGDLGSG